MKKRFILLPLLLFVLAGCDPVVEPTDSTEPTTVEPTDPTTGDTTTDPEVSWKDSLPEGFSTLGEILAGGLEDDVFQTRAKVIGLNGGQIYLQDGENSSMLLYDSTKAKLATVGDVLDLKVKLAYSYSAPQLNLVGETGDFVITEGIECEVTPVVINDRDDYTERLADLDETEGEGNFLVLIRGVTTSLNVSNAFTITLSDGQDIPAYVGFSQKHNDSGTNRPQMLNLINRLHQNEVTFDMMGVYLKSAAWQVGICTTDYLIGVPEDLPAWVEPEPEPGDEDALSVTINNSIPTGWTYISNDPVGYPDPGYYGNGGLKMNFIGIGITSPVLDKTYHTVKLSGVLNTNTKTGDPTALSLVVGGATVQSWVANVTPYTDVTLTSAAGFTQFSIILTAYAGYNVNLQTIVIS